MEFVAGGLRLGLQSMVRILAAAIVFVAVVGWVQRRSCGGGAEIGVLGRVWIVLMMLSGLVASCCLVGEVVRVAGFVANLKELQQPSDVLWKYNVIQMQPCCTFTAPAMGFC